MLLKIDRLTKRFGGLTVTDDLCLDVPYGELHAIIGPNGAGKTTLLRQLTGELRPDAGSIVLEGRDITSHWSHQRALAGISRSYQVTSLFSELTTLANIKIAIQAVQGHSFRFWRPVIGDASLDKPAWEILERVGLAAVAGVKVCELAHGMQRQLEIGMTLASNPKLLLLDEPMAGMGRQESAEVVRLLQSLKGDYGILLVEHDIDAVLALADRISVLVQGRCIACGTIDEIRGDQNVRGAYLGDFDHAA